MCLCVYVQACPVITVFGRITCHKYLNLISYWTQYKFPLVFLSYNKSSHLFIINFEHFHLLFFVEGLCPELDHIRGTSSGPEIFGSDTVTLGNKIISLIIIDISTTYLLTIVSLPYHTHTHSVKKWVIVRRFIRLH